MALLVAGMIEKTRWHARRPGDGCSPHRGHHWYPASRLPHPCWTASPPARTGGSPARRSAHRRTRIGGLPPSAAWNASRLRRSRHREIATTASGSSSTVHVCAPKQPSAAAARCWVRAHRSSTSSRRPGAGRNVVTWIRPACSVIEAHFPPAPEAAHLRDSGFRPAAVPEPDAQASGGGCDGLIESARTLPGALPLSMSGVVVATGQEASRERSICLPISAPLRLSACALRNRSASSESPSWSRPGCRSPGERVAQAGLDVPDQVESSSLVPVMVLFLSRHRYLLSWRASAYPPPPDHASMPRRIGPRAEDSAGLRAWAVPPASRGGRPHPAADVRQPHVPGGPGRPGGPMTPR